MQQAFPSLALSTADNASAETHSTGVPKRMRARAICHVKVTPHKLAVAVGGSVFTPRVAARREA